MLDSTTKPSPRYPAMVFALAGDSTITSAPLLGPFGVGHLLRGSSSRVARNLSAGPAASQVAGKGDTGHGDGHSPPPVTALSSSSPPFRGRCSRPSFGCDRTARRTCPDEGGFVLSANHLSNFDPWPLGLPLFPGRFLRFMAKSRAVLATARLDHPRRWRLPRATRRARRRGDRDGDAPLPRGSRRRHVPRGHATREGIRKKHEARWRSRRSADRARCRRPARPRRDLAAPTASPGSGRCASRTDRRSRSTTSPSDPREAAARRRPIGSASRSSASRLTLT